MKIHHTFIRVAHRYDRRPGGGPFLTTDNGMGWRLNGNDYICASGLCRHFEIPNSMNELEVQIIVADRRPDEEAQRLWSYSADDGLRIEREWGDKERNAAGHTLHQPFANHVQSGFRAARKIDSKVWMLCRYKLVLGVHVVKNCGIRPTW